MTNFSQDGPAYYDTYLEPLGTEPYERVAWFKFDFWKHTFPYFFTVAPDSPL